MALAALVRIRRQAEEYAEFASRKWGDGAEKETKAMRLQHLLVCITDDLCNHFRARGLRDATRAWFSGLCRERLQSGDVLSAMRIYGRLLRVVGVGSAHVAPMRIPVCFQKAATHAVAEAKTLRRLELVLARTMQAVSEGRIMPTTLRCEAPHVARPAFLRHAIHDFCAMHADKLFGLFFRGKWRLAFRPSPCSPVMVVQPDDADTALRWRTSLVRFIQTCTPCVCWGPAVGLLTEASSTPSGAAAIASLAMRCVSEAPSQSPVQRAEVLPWSAYERGSTSSPPRTGSCAPRKRRRLIWGHEVMNHRGNGSANDVAFGTITSAAQREGAGARSEWARVGAIAAGAFLATSH